MKKIVIVEPNKKLPYKAVIDGSLESMQNLVDGWIEVCRPPLHTDGAVIICNEEGKIRHLRPNRKLHFEDGVLYDVICGTFFIINAPEDSDDFESLTDEQIQKYIEMYGAERTM